ncbi:flagellar export chaperone FliS [Chitinimonas lacunae]|uniref:Flagellar export chaperone FliS n=1 Tax=Chitinimonas lacunae TaxID=1963018 RepID=A0ABV8MWR5_9NEIS
MVAKIRSALNAYGQSSVELDVQGASPHRLVCLLYEGAIKAVALAKVHMQAGAIADKGASISKAIAIIEEGLRLSLDKEGAGAELAQNLDALYEYMTLRLLTANLKNDVEALDEVYGLLVPLREAWEAIDKQHTASPGGSPSPSGDQNAPPRGSLSYGRA